VLAENIAGVERIGADRGPAIPASGAQVVQAFQVAAFALPVADRIIDKLQFADAAKIRNWKYRVENRLEPDVLAAANPSEGNARTIFSVPRSGWESESRF
jgi:hypothetical protein